MAAPAPVDPSAAPAPKKRSRWKKIIGWGITLVLLGGVLVEGGAVFFYQSSLANLDAAITASRKPGKGVGIPLNEIGKHLRGFPLRDEDPNRGKNAPKTEGSKRRKVSYHWPSLLTKFRLVATVDEKENVIGVEGAYGDDKPRQQTGLATAAPVAAPTPTPPAAAPKPDPPKTFGCKDVPDGALVLAVDDFKVIGSLRRARCGSLSRELFRQAVLIAARDELGVDVLDVVLGEVALSPNATEGAPLHIDVQAEPDFKNPGQARFIVKMMREDATGKKFEWSSSPASIPLKPTLETLADRTEVLSRGDLVKGLKAAGYEKSKSPGVAVESPPGCEKRMDLVSQFARLRHLHAERRLKGETVQNLGNLVRTYAHLGDLTEHHWAPISKAFRARAVLYANRMIAKYGENVETLAHRAYAWAFTGNHELALKDLETIQGMERKEPAAGKDRPQWLKLIGAFCEYRARDLDGVKGELEELALYLKMRMLDPLREEEFAMDAIADMLKVNAACWRAVERMCDTGSLGPTRDATARVADQTWLAFYRRVQEVPGLPKEVLSIARSQSGTGRNATEKGAEKNEADDEEDFRPGREEGKARVALINRLCDTQPGPEQGTEPSWRVLGQMLSDENFVQAWRVIWFEKNSLGIPKEEMNEEIQRRVSQAGSHRFANYLRFYGTADPAGMKEGMLQIYRTVPGFIYEMPCMPLVNASASVEYSTYIPLANQIDNHWDQVQGDLWRVQAWQFKDWAAEAANLSVQVLPNMPDVVASVLQSTPQFDEKAQKEWEEKCSGSAYLMKVLGRRYQRMVRTEDAIRCFEKSISLGPSHGAYLDLATEFRKVGELAASRAMLEEATKLPGYGLEQSQASLRIAYLLMGEGNWDEAMKYAEEAASAYSADGLRVAARAAEGLKQWSVAEDYYRKSAERYDICKDDWYRFCLRTQKGDLEQARKLAEKQWQKLGDSPGTWYERWSKVIPLLAQGDQKQTMLILGAPIHADHGDLRQKLVAGIYADRRGGFSYRDQLWEEVVKDFGPHSYLFTIVNLFKRAIKDPKQFHWNKIAFQEFADEYDGRDVTLAYYCAGEFLESHGEHALSEEYLQVSATSFDVTDEFCLLGTLALRQRGIKPGETRLNEQPDDREEALRILRRGYYARKSKKMELAEKFVNDGVQKLPQFVYGYKARGMLRQVQGRFSEAVTDYREALKLNPESEHACFQLATILAACSDDTVRDGKEALKLAERGVELSGKTAAWHKWILAAAHAELGDFKKAVELQEEAVKDAPEIVDWKKQLELYEAGKPYRYDGKTEMAANPWNWNTR